MSADFTVKSYGTDAYGRTVWMTVYMNDWWEAVQDQIGFRPRILQGAFMLRNGGGAAASEGAHDKAGCIDVESDGLTSAQINRVIWKCRINGAAAWRRDLTARHGGMRPHIHITLGSDGPLSPMAQIIWNSYLSGGDGISGPYPDYERRPNPIVTTPPEDLMAISEEDVQKIADAVWAKLLGNPPKHAGATLTGLRAAVDAIKNKIGA